MLLTNTLSSNSVRREEFKGREWLVAPLTLVKSMRLDKGYVPENEVAKSVNAWNGTPLTLNHPRDASGNLVSANSPAVAENTWIGHVFNAEKRVEDTVYIDGEAWIDIRNARSLGGKAEQMVNDLENGQDISVSSSYFGDMLPSGNYDGQHRSKVKGNLRPDHIAILPGKEGRCSMDDGCMVGVQAANVEPSDDDLIIPSANYLSEARTPSFSGTESSSFTEVSKGLQVIIDGLGLDVEKPEGVTDPRVSHLNDEQRQEIAELSLLGDPDADNLDDLRLFQVVNHNNGNLNENALRAVVGGPGQRAEIPESVWQSAASKAVDLLSSEFDVQVDSERMSNAVSDIDRTPPSAAQNAGQFVLDLDDEYGVDAMNRTGWARANQLADGEELSWNVISRMAQFNRHQDNTEYDSFSDLNRSEMSDDELAELAKDNGTMAWFGWGAREGISWAQDKLDEREMELAENSDDPIDPTTGSGEDLTGMHAANQLSQARRPEYSGTETTSWGDVPKTLEYFTSELDIDGDTVDDLSQEDRQAIAQHTLLGDSDADTADELIYFPVVNPSTGDLNEGALEAVISGRGQSADIPDETYASADSVARSLLEEEFDREGLTENSLLSRARNVFNSILGAERTESDESAESDTGSSQNDNMSEKTQTLVENHGFKAKNLPDEDTECFNSIYNQFVEEDDDDPEASNNEGMTEDEIEQAVNEKVDELVDERVEEALAQNREQQKKDELASKIIANSDEWEEDDREELLDSNEAVLESLADSATQQPSGNADHRGQIGGSANASSNSASSMPSLTANGRINEGDD